MGSGGKPRTPWADPNRIIFTQGKVAAPSKTASGSSSTRTSAGWIKSGDGSRISRDRTKWCAGRYRRVDSRAFRDVPHRASCVPASRETQGPTRFVSIVALVLAFSNLIGTRTAVALLQKNPIALSRWTACSKAVALDCCCQPVMARVYDCMAFWICLLLDWSICHLARSATSAKEMS